MLKRWPAAAALFACLCAGCADELGPKRFETTTVAGRILYSGRPIDGGWIELIPVDGTAGSVRSSPVAKDGTFKVSKAAVGRCAIRLVKPPLTMPGRTITISGNMAPLVLDMNLEVTEYMNQKRKSKAAIRTWPPSARGTPGAPRSE